MIDQREQPDNADPFLALHAVVEVPLKEADTFGGRSKAAGEDIQREGSYIPVENPEGLYVAEGIEIGEGSFESILVYPPSV